MMLFTSVVKGVLSGEGRAVRGCGGVIIRGWWNSEGDKRSCCFGFNIRGTNVCVGKAVVLLGLWLKSWCWLLSRLR